MFLVWPLTWTRQMAKIHGRIVERGDDPERFDTAMARPWIRSTLWIMPLLGVVVIVMGLIGG